MSQTHGSPLQISLKVNQATTISAYLLLKPAPAAAGTGNGMCVALWDTITAIIPGISQDNSKGATGTSVLVAIGGCAKLQAGASVSAGAFIVGLTATSQGIEDASLGFITTATTTVPYGIGVALDSGDTNSVFEVLIMPRTVRWAK